MDKTKDLVLGRKIKAVYKNIDERYNLLGMTSIFLLQKNHQCPVCEKDFKFTGNVIDNVKALSMVVIIREGIYEPYVLCNECLKLTKNDTDEAQEAIKKVEDKMRELLLDDNGLTEHRKNKIERIAKDEGYSDLEEYLNEMKQIKGVDKLEDWKFGFLSAFLVNYVNDKFVNVDKFELKQIKELKELKTSFIDKKFDLCELELVNGINLKIKMNNFGDMEITGLNELSIKALKEHKMHIPIK